MSTYTPKTDWKNFPDQSTPVTAADLVRIETGIQTAHQEIAAIPAAPAAGTAPLLTTGTDTSMRTWSAKMIADEVKRQIAAIPPA